MFDFGSDLGSNGLAILPTYYDCTYLPSVPLNVNEFRILFSNYFALGWRVICRQHPSPLAVAKLFNIIVFYK